MAWCLRGRRFVQHYRQHPHFYRNGMATQPTSAKVLVVRKYAPVPAKMEARAKSGTNVIIGLGFIDAGPVGDSDANVRLYDFLQQQNQRASHFMIDGNIHDNPQRRSERRRLPLYSLGVGYGWRDLGQQSSTQHAGWYPKKFKIPLDFVQPESTLRVNHSTRLPPPSKILDPSHLSGRLGEE